MSNIVISDHLKDEILKFLKKDKKAGRKRSSRVKMS
jgi:hypothetical protein